MKIKLVFLVAVVAFMGCRRQTEAPAEIPAASTIASTPERNPKIPPEVTYPITRESEEYNGLSKKRSIDVALNMRVSKDVLVEIANEIKATETRPHERTFIFYRLPSPIPDWEPAPWATSHFNPMPGLPTFRAEIFGLDDQAIRTLKDAPMPQADELIGCWIVDAQYVGHRVTIYRTGGGTMIEELSPDGSPFIESLTAVPTSDGHRFKKHGSSDQYEIDSRGVLRIHGAENRIVAAAQPLNIPSRSRR